MKDIDASRRKAYERRLWIWLGALVSLYAVYVII